MEQQNIIQCAVLCHEARGHSHLFSLIIPHKPHLFMFTDIKMWFLLNQDLNYFIPIVVPCTMVWGTIDFFLLPQLYHNSPKHVFQSVKIGFKSVISYLK